MECKLHSGEIKDVYRMVDCVGEATVTMFRTSPGPVLVFEVEMFGAEGEARDRLSCTPACFVSMSVIN